MGDLNDHLRDYAARHYRYHAERATPDSVAVVGALPEQESRQETAHGNLVRRGIPYFTVVLAAGLVLVFLPIWERETRFHKRHVPYQPEFTQAPELVAHEAYGFALDPNPRRKVALWVGYEVQPVSKRSIGNIKYDPDVPREYQLAPSFFNETGLQKAKMVPVTHAGGLDERDLEQLIFATVIGPHYPSLVRKGGIKWQIDDAIRELGKKEKVWVVRGPIYREGPEVIDGTEVPDAYFCIRITKGEYKAWLYENQEDVKGYLSSFESSLKEIEQATGLDFSALRDRR